MRIVTRVLPVVMALLALTSCVSRVGPNAAAGALSNTSQPPSRSPLPWECSTNDITVTGGLDEKPVVTVPTDCQPPTTLLTQDVIVGTGKEAVQGSNLDVNYVMIAWVGGQLDTTWSGTNSLPLSVTNLGNAGWATGWDEGLPGIREGGRRLLVVPPTKRETGHGQTLIYVVDAVRVN
jgi:peptidylprolyl isomerase